MIVHDGHLGRSFGGPPENDAPLVIDPNGAQARQIASERFQTVAGRNGKVAESVSAVHPSFDTTGVIADHCESRSA